MTLRRRDFLLFGTAAGAVAGAGVLVPLGFVLTDDDSGATGARLASYPRTFVASLGDLEEGQPVWFDYPVEGASNVLVRLATTATGGIGPERDVVAFSNQCTHMGCTVTAFDPASGTLGPCPCHFSSFDLGRDGVTSLGQATQSLPRVLLELDGEDLYATGLFRLIYGHNHNLGGESLVAVAGEVQR
jgi:arsenite oxidase small subunit